MNRWETRWAVLALMLAATWAGPVRAQATKYDKPAAYKLSEVDRMAIAELTGTLEQALAKLPKVEAQNRDELADVAVYARAGAWALRFNEFYTQKDVAMTLGVLNRGLERARAAFLAEADRHGRVVETLEILTLTAWH